MRCGSGGGGGAAGDGGAGAPQGLRACASSLHVPSASRLWVRDTPCSAAPASAKRRAARQLACSPRKWRLRNGLPMGRDQCWDAAQALRSTAVVREAAGSLRYLQGMRGCRQAGGNRRWAIQPQSAQGASPVGGQQARRGGGGMQTCPHAVAYALPGMPSCLITQQPECQSRGRAAPHSRRAHALADGLDCQRQRGGG